MPQDQNGATLVECGEVNFAGGIRANVGPGCTTTVPRVPLCPASAAGNLTLSVDSDRNRGPSLFTQVAQPLRESPARYTEAKCWTLTRFRS